jgi:hypothetical protein
LETDIFFSIHHPGMDFMSPLWGSEFVGEAVLVILRPTGLIYISNEYRECEKFVQVWFRPCFLIYAFLLQRKHLCHFENQPAGAQYH